MTPNPINKLREKLIPDTLDIQVASTQEMNPVPVPKIIDPNAPTYYCLVRFKARCELIGPVTRWQDAVMSVFGQIVTDQDVKIIEAPPKIHQDKFVTHHLNQPLGWFKPYIPTSAIGMTLNPDDAWGPPEISKKMAEIAAGIEKATSPQEIDVWYSTAIPLLRYLPMEICARFSDLVNHERKKYVSTQVASESEKPGEGTDSESAR